MTQLSKNPHRRGIVLMLLSIVFFTVNTLAIRGLVDLYPAISGWHAVIYRGVAGLAVVWSVYGFGRSYRFRVLFQKPLLFWRGILGGVGTGLFYITVIELGAGRATFLTLTYPIFAALMAHFFLKERLTSRRLTWIVISFVGLGVFFLEKGLSQEVWFYDAVGILVAVMSAGVVVLIRKLHQTEHGSTIYGSQAFYGLIFAIPVSGSSTMELPLTATLLLIVAGFVVAWGQLTMTFAYRHLDVSTGSSLQMLLPVATALGSCLLFGERFGMMEIIGATITLGATWKINRETSNHSKTMTKIKPKKP
ncbi:DMT family transporter [bacterium]|nr:DMT family transporter [Akkermansiaceae bacterium]MDB4568344.1 DMT family transporter [Akkermansiaceae bacterium]MDB4588297.1 DMT family transporter [bacterium]